MLLALLAAVSVIALYYFASIEEKREFQDDTVAVEAWCNKVSLYNQSTERFRVIPDPSASATSEGFQVNLELQNKALSETQEAERILVAEAPSYIKPELGRYMAADSQPLGVSDEEALEKAQKRVDNYVRARCDLDILVVARP